MQESWARTGQPSWAVSGPGTQAGTGPSWRRVSTTGYSAHTPLAAMGKEGQGERALPPQWPLSALPHTLSTMPEGKGETFTGPSFVITEDGIDGCTEG